VDEFDIKNWYLWSYQENNGLFNMSADQWLARQMSLTLDRPILRFYGWRPYCISLGYHQKETEINLNLCKQARFDVVRRPTGGRAILHAEELTYSVIYPSKRLNVTKFYHLTHLPFVAALNDYHIAAEFNQTQTDFKRFYASEKSSICFATTAKYEVALEKKKLIGSAQRVYEHAVLQHGSVLLGQFHEQLIDLLNITREKKNILKKYTKNKTAYIWQVSKNITAKALAKKITEKYTEIFGIKFFPFKTEFISIGSKNFSTDYSLDIFCQGNLMK
jgi:lipoate-protein ligase A